MNSLRTETTLIKIENILTEKLEEIRKKRQTLFGRKFLLCLFKNELWPLNIFSYIAYIVSFVLLVYTQFSFEIRPKYEILIILFVMLCSVLLTLFLFIIYTFTISKYFEHKIIQIISVIKQLEQNIQTATYPCVFCNTLQSVTLVLALRDDSAVFVPTNLLVDGDIVILSSQDFNENRIGSDHVEIIIETDPFYKQHMDLFKIPQIKSPNDISVFKLYRVITPPIKSYIEKIGVKDFLQGWYCDSNIAYYSKYSNWISYIFITLFCCYAILRKIVSLYYGNIEAFEIESILISGILINFPLSLPLIWISFVVCSSSIIRIILDQNQTKTFPSFLDVVLKMKRLLTFKFNTSVDNPPLIDKFSRINALCVFEKEGVIAYCSQQPTHISFLTRNSTVTESYKESILNHHRLIDIDIQQILSQDQSIHLQTWNEYRENLTLLTMASQMCSTCNHPVVRMIFNDLIHKADTQHESINNCYCWLQRIFDVESDSNKEMESLKMCVNIKQKKKLKKRSRESYQQTTHMFSNLIRKQDDELMLFSVGSSDFILDSCSVYWDGHNFMPLNKKDRNLIVNSLLEVAHKCKCLSFAFTRVNNPFNYVIKFNFSVINHICRKKYFEKTKFDLQISNQLSILPLITSLTPSTEIDVNDRKQIYCGSVFFQDNIINDSIDFVSNLGKNGIRFIYFSFDDIIISKCCAKKLGFDSGWNSFISLKSDKDVYQSKNSACIEEDNTIKNNNAKLPRGIENIRPHLLNVDDVPLLVPLFTDCNNESVQEMIKIMQEYSEVVAVVSSCHNTNCINIHSQADISIKIVPVWHENCFASIQHKSKFTLSCDETFPSFDLECPSINSNIMRLSSFINTIDSVFIFMPNYWDRIEMASSYARRFVQNIQISLVFIFICHITLASLFIISFIFYSPSPLHLSQILLFTLWHIPILAASLMINIQNPHHINTIPKKNNIVFVEAKKIILYLICLIVIPITLGIIVTQKYLLYKFCLSLPNISCPFYFYDKIYIESWKNKTETPTVLLISRRISSYFLTLFFIILSFVCLNVFQLFSFRSITISWLFSCCLCVAVEIIVTFLSPFDFLLVNSSKIMQPFVYYSVACLLLLLLIIYCILTCYKYRVTKNYHRKLQHEQIIFETKLGLNSPV